MSIHSQKVTREKLLFPGWVMCESILCMLLRYLFLLPLSVQFMNVSVFNAGGIPAMANDNTKSLLHNSNKRVGNTIWTLKADTNTRRRLTGHKLKYNK